MNLSNRVRGNVGTLLFIVLGLSVWAYGFPFDNNWTFVCGMLLWLLAVANARITQEVLEKDGD